jgi:methyl-accepting chemotaxis protein
VKAAVGGKLATRADAAKFVGGWNTLVGGVNETLEAVIGPLNVAANYVDQISRGAIPAKITDSYNGDFNLIKNNLNLCIESINALVADAGMLVQAAIDGKLATRADATKHQGDYRKIVEGVNKTLDAVIGPLNVAANYVDQISKGAIPAKITDSYNGDFNLIKNNLNVAIDSINALVTDAGMLAQAAVEGRLGTRAEAGKHQGDYRKIVDGVNQTLDLVITPVNETIAVLKRLAEGDLTVAMSGDYKGDFDVLKKALVDSLDSFNDILGQVNTAVEQVTAGSLQVSQASQSLSQGATEQASSLEQITSSITEVSGQTKQNTENAIQVNTLAKTAREDAEQGNIQMKDLVAAMSDINASAEEIRKIVKAIDDISFQINLLALNANVEAARAGKYGKGFAVVAEEVRNLAVRSASSVKDTTRMVDEAISNIERGNALVDVTAKQLASIVAGAAKVAALAEEVSTASKEQTQGLEQISTGLGQIDQVTQANTASAEESASAAEELSSQSQQLKGMLGRFVLKASDKKMNNAEMMQLLRDELAKQQGGHKVPVAAQQARAHDAGNGKKKIAGGRVNPADLIALDDDNFGKF